MKKKDSAWNNLDEVVGGEVQGEESSLNRNGDTPSSSVGDCRQGMEVRRNFSSQGHLIHGIAMGLLESSEHMPIA